MTVSSLAVLSACGSDDATSTDSVATTTAPTTTATLAPTEASTTTAVPATTEAPTTTDTAQPERNSGDGALDFQLDGEAPHIPTVFGYAALTEVNQEALVADVSEVLGDADADTGWVPMPAPYACTGASEYRSLLWDDIRYVLARPEIAPEMTYLHGWTIGDTTLAYSPPLDAEIAEASGITTDAGIGLGTSVEQLEGVDWAQSWRQDNQFLGLAGVGPVIFQLDASDEVVAMSYEQNDC